MANVIIPDAERRETASRIMEQYGVDRNDPAVREAAEIAAVRQQEAIDNATSGRRRY